MEKKKKVKQIKIYAIKLSHDMWQRIQLDLVRLMRLWIIPKARHIYLFSTFVTKATEWTSMDRAWKNPQRKLFIKTYENLYKSWLKKHILGTNI